jgi:Uma2 family endonuclease
MTIGTRLPLDQFLAQPETEPASEYLCGEVVQKPMPTIGHGRVQRQVLRLLQEYLDQTGRGEAIPELRCVLGPPGEERAYVPDVAVLPPDLLPRTEAQNFATLYAPPPFAVESLTPDQSTGQLADKLQFYLLYGVRAVWLLDPIERTVRVFTPERAAVRLAAGDVLEGGDLLPGFRVLVDDLFAPLDRGREQPA